MEAEQPTVIDPVLPENEEVDEEGRRVSFWSFFREAGNVPLQELLRREEEAMKTQTPASKSNNTIRTPEKKGKTLSIRVPSFFSKKTSNSAAISTKNKAMERNEEEKEDE